MKNIRTSVVLMASVGVMVACSASKGEDKEVAEAVKAVDKNAETLLADAEPVVTPQFPDVVVKIDDSIEIKNEDVEKIAQAMFQANLRFFAQAKPEQLAEIRKQIRAEAIENLIMMRLLFREATAAGTVVTKEEIDEFLKSQLPEGETLASVAEKQGMKEGDLFEQIQSGMSIEKLMKQNVEAVADPTDEEVKAEYDAMLEKNPKMFDMPETVEASHILVKVEKDASEEAKAEAKKKLEDIRQKILDGEDFGKMAEEFSDCPSGKRAQGSLGQFGHGQMVKEFDEAAFSQPVGEVGPVFETSFGYHIVKVTAKNEGKAGSFEDVKDKLAQYLGNQKKQQVQQDFVKSVRDKAKVEILGPDAEKPEEKTPAEDENRPLPAWAE